MRRLLLLLLTLALVAVAADVLALRYAERTLAERVQDSTGLALTPDVDVAGRPFLLQALRGRYDEVEVRAAAVPAGTLRFDTVRAELDGVEVPLSDVLSGSVTTVPVEQLRTRAVLGYDTLTAAVADRGLRVEPAADGRVRVVGSVEVLGQTLEASAFSRPTLDGGAVVVTAESFEVGVDLADDLLTRTLGDRFDVRFDVGALPFGLAIMDLQVTPDGVVLQASAADAVLTAP